MKTGSHNYKIEYSKHDKDDPLFVTETLRLCVHCGADNRPIHELSMFKQNAKGELSVVCGDCIAKIRREEDDRRSVSAAVVMSTALTKAADVGRKSGHGFADFFSGVCDAAGGRHAVSSMTGKLVRRVLRKSLAKSAVPTDLDRGVKVAEQVIKAAAIEQKTGTPINWRDITEEEQREILMEPAKLLMLKDKKFRDELLSNPDVRKALLSEVGVELLEAREEAGDDDED